MPGASSAPSLVGARAEALAQFMLGAWGTAVPVGQQDYGLDLHCALTEIVGKRAWVTAPYSVQVKSNLDPWTFSTTDEVRWLIRHPLPLYLCIVEKAKARILLYHTFPRFLVWMTGQLPAKLDLVPDQGPNGRCVLWTEGGTRYSLGAPILELNCADLFDDGRLADYRAILARWIDEELWNLGLIRTSLYRFRMPQTYTTNSTKFPAFVEQGLVSPVDEQLRTGVVQLCEALDCIGSQLEARKDTLGALEAALLVRFLKQRFAMFFAGDRSIEGPRALSQILGKLAGPAPSGYLWQGVDALEEHLKAHPLVRGLL